MKAETDVSMGGMLTLLGGEKVSSALIIIGASKYKVLVMYFIGNSSLDCVNIIY